MKATKAKTKAATTTETKTKPEKASLGRIVLLRDGPILRPAVVLCVNDGGSTVDLGVIPTTHVTVTQGDDEGCWQWPKRG